MRICMGERLAASWQIRRGPSPELVRPTHAAVATEASSQRSASPVWIAYAIRSGSRPTPWIIDDDTECKKWRPRSTAPAHRVRSRSREKARRPAGSVARSNPCRANPVHQITLDGARKRPSSRTGRPSRTLRVFGTLSTPALAGPRRVSALHPDQGHALVEYPGPDLTTDGSTNGEDPVIEEPGARLLRARPGPWPRLTPRRPGGPALRVSSPENRDGRGSAQAGPLPSSSRRIVRGGSRSIPLAIG